VPRQKPVEHCRADIADMGKAGGAGGKTDSNGCGHFLKVIVISET